MSAGIWDMYGTDIEVEPPPGQPENTGLTQNYGIVGTPLETSTAGDRYNNKHTDFQEDTNMHHALTECFLSLFATGHS